MDLSRRLELQTLLEGLLGTSNVHFQPPPNIQMKYPAIVYELDDIHTDFADNRPYYSEKRYQVTVIDRDPDSGIPNKIAMLPKNSFNRFFVANGLNHTVFTLYF